MASADSPRRSIGESKKDRLDRSSKVPKLDREPLGQDNERPAIRVFPSAGICFTARRCCESLRGIIHHFSSNLLRSQDRANAQSLAIVRRERPVDPQLRRVSFLRRIEGRPALLIGYQTALRFQSLVERSSQLE